jgi:DinB family protein
MRTRFLSVTFVATLLPSLAVAQQATTVAADAPAVPATATAAMPAPAKADSAPVASAFRDNFKQVSRNLIDAGEEMPARKYSYKPTKAQMSFGKIMVHLAEGNDFLCGAIGGVKAPERTKVAETDSKVVLVARLKETFAFCDQALAQLDDSKLAEQLPMFGQTMSRAGVIIITTGDWADHYSQEAIYLRLNGLLPPTAKKKPAM